MEKTLSEIARKCLVGAEENSMSFPEIVGELMASGFEGYMVDFRRKLATYYASNGECVELATHEVGDRVAPAFDATLVQRAIQEAQASAAGYSYKGFCKKVVAAGCAGYMVSFTGRRALYFARTAETHVETFPD